MFASVKCTSNKCFFIFKFLLKNYKQKQSFIITKNHKDYKLQMFRKL